MRKILLGALVGTALIAAAPTTALARHHRRHHHHAVRHRTWGSDPTMAGAQEQTAGTVSSFSNGVLMIMLTDGSTVGGRVTSNTEIECQAPENEMLLSHEDGSDSSNSSGDGGGSGSGGDNGVEAEQQGENEMTCTTASLTPGTVVQEAELKVSSAGAAWEKVDLITG